MPVPWYMHLLRKFLMLNMMLVCCLLILYSENGKYLGGVCFKVILHS